jgi:hypothetical protein
MNADSHVDPEKSKDTPQDAPQPPQAATPTTSTNEAGNIPAGSPATSSGQSPRLMSPTGQPLARAPDGRLYNPAKGEPPPKATPMADMKPLPVRTYDESAGESLTPKGGIKGLDAIPKGWPQLPGNVSQGQEIAWVQSERLLVVKEQAAGGIRVDLSKARSPAPSMAALSWLETSIRSYAKFIEVASKQASSGQDEAEFVRKERMAIGEIDALLAEMYDAEG